MFIFLLTLWTNHAKKGCKFNLSFFLIQTSGNFIIFPLRLKRLPFLAETASILEVEMLRWGYVQVVHVQSNSSVTMFRLDRIFIKYSFKFYIIRHSIFYNPYILITYVSTLHRISTYVTSPSSWKGWVTPLKVLSNPINISILLDDLKVYQHGG